MEPHKWELSYCDASSTLLIIGDPRTQMEIYVRSKWTHRFEYFQYSDIVFTFLLFLYQF